MLLVTEAGGKVTDLSGQPYRPGEREMLATNGRIHPEMMDVIAGIAGNSTKSL
jgi:myo-inositol-1(or 4)-monophosphatase